MQQRKWWILGLAMWLAACGGPAEDARSPENDPQPENIEAWRRDTALLEALRGLEADLTAVLDGGQTPAVAVAVVKNGQVAWLQARGLKSIEQPTDSIDTHTLFRLASLSKGFAPAVLAPLVQAGQLSWDDPVKCHLPDFLLHAPQATQTLTLRHVLSQATGLPYQTFSNRLNNGEDYALIRPDLAHVPLSHTPGQYYNYQNVAYSLVAEVATALTGRSYDSLLLTGVLQPLGMWDAGSGFFHLLDSPNYALPHAPGDAGAHRIDLSDKYYSASPAAGLNASIADMAQWLRALQGYAPGVLDSATLAQQFAIQVGFEPNEPSVRLWRPYAHAGYGLGWRIVQRTPDWTIVTHGGLVNGYRNEIALDLESQLGICVLSNTAGNQAAHLATHFLLRYRQVTGQLSATF